MPPTFDGIVDLSHWNPEPLDFAAARAAGIAAAILKATQGADGIDPVFAARVAAARAAGLLVGAYHFLDAADPVAQAAHFLAVAGTLPVLALDLERDPSGPSTIPAQAAGAAARIATATGRPPLIYVGRWFPGLPQAALATCPLWLPEYGAAPVCPPGWRQWRLWQYTDRAEVPGLGRVDRSRFAGDPAALAAWWQQGDRPTPRRSAAVADA